MAIFLRRIIRFIQRLVFRIISLFFSSFAGNETSNWGTGCPSGNILVQTSCLDITMSWKTSCVTVGHEHQLSSSMRVRHVTVSRS